MSWVRIPEGAPKGKDMTDKEKRPKGNYTKVYTMIVDGVDYKVTEVTKVGRDFQIIGFERGYNPPIPYKGK